MHTVTASAEIQSSAEKVWQALDNYGNISVFHPLVKQSLITNGIETGLGAERVCHFYDGSQVRETITRYVPEQGYSVILADFSLPLKQAMIHLDVESVNKEVSRLKMKFEFEPKFGLVGWLMAQTLIKPKLKQVFAQLMKGLDEHLRTGQAIGPGGILLATTA